MPLHLLSWGKYHVIGSKQTELEGRQLVTGHFDRSGIYPISGVVLFSLVPAVLVKRSLY